MTMTMPGDFDQGEGGAFVAPDCLHCGACCFSTAEHYVRVTGDDWTRLRDVEDRWAAFENHRAFMRMSGGHCAALRIEPADAASGAPARFVCAIYERRPQTCRDLGRGSPSCEAEWLRKRGDAHTAAAG